jgi:hypothetical protein
MKKIFVIFGIFAVVSAANADWQALVDEATDKISEVTREDCMSGPGMYWVEANKECVPRDVCSFLWKGAYDNTYCIRDFSDTQVRHVGRAEHLAASYLENKIGKSAGVNCHVNMPEAGDKKSFSGDNYIPCVTSDGRFFVFQFNDTTETLAGTPNYAFNALCGSFGGNSYNGVCRGLTEAQCDTLDKQMDDAFVGDDDTTYDKVTGDCRLD